MNNSDFTKLKNLNIKDYAIKEMEKNLFNINDKLKNYYLSETFADAYFKGLSGIL